MKKIIKITGPNKIKGKIKISGAKNAILPIMIACLNSKSTVTLGNVPELEDVSNTLKIFQMLNVSIIKGSKAETIKINAGNITETDLKKDVISKKRSSIWLLAPMLQRFGKISMYYPGGCDLNKQHRKIDLHIQILESMGAKIICSNGHIEAQSSSKLQGTNFKFNKISVGATITGILAACFAQGKSTLSNCAFEPEIVDLCMFLNAIGCKIDGIGTQELKIIGVKNTIPACYRIISDRIEAGTYICAAGITQGQITLENIPIKTLDNFLPIFEKIGLQIVSLDSSTIQVSMQNKLINSVDISTNPYPFFATDLQPQLMSLMCLSNNKSKIIENVYDNRFSQAYELRKMGAQVNIIDSNTAIVTGSKSLSAHTKLQVHDLRSGAALILAAMAAHGTSVILDSQIIDRGYSNIARKLANCGINISEETIIPISKNFDINKQIPQNLLNQKSDDKFYKEIRE